MTIFDQLRRDEGMRRTMYRDSLGYETFGVGHKATTPLSDAAIEQILHDDVAAAAANIDAVFTWAKSLSEARYGALINLVFNMGLGGVLSFKNMLHAMRESRWDDAARELLDSKYATQVGLRAERLATQLSEDRWV